MAAMTNHRPLKNSRIAVYILALAAMLATMFLLRKCSHDEVSPFAPQKGHSGGDTIDVAIEVSPVCYSLAGDTATGLDYEMVKDLSQYLNRPVKFHPFAPLQYALDGLEAGRYDIVVSSLPSTVEMKQRFLMSPPLYIDRQVLVQRLGKDSLPAVKSQQQLGGDTVWVPARSPFVARINSLAREIGDTIIVMEDPSYSSEQLLILVALGEVKQAVVNDLVAQSMAGDYPQVDISTGISFSQFQTWAMRRDSEPLADSISAWLESYKASARYSGLIRQYLH